MILIFDQYELVYDSIWLIFGALALGTQIWDLAERSRFSNIYQLKMISEAGHPAFGVSKIIIVTSENMHHLPSSYFRLGVTEIVSNGKNVLGNWLSRRFRVI